MDYFGRWESGDEWDTFCDYLKKWGRRNNGLYGCFEERKQGHVNDLGSRESKIDLCRRVINGREV